jgi:hypothetical protein
VFLSPGQPLAGRSEGEVVENELAAVPTLSTSILSATQGSYTTAQLVLDITQGARVSGSSYEPSSPPFLSLPVSPRAAGASQRATASQVQGWAAVLERAHSAPQVLEPGLLAAQIPGGGAYVPADGVEAVDGVLAAGRNGHLAAVLGSSATTLAGIAQLRLQHRLIVADLPTGPAGYADLRALAASRPAGELLVVIQRPVDEPNNRTAGQAGHELLWVAIAGLGGGRTLTSQTTNQDGLIAATDIAPTILNDLGLRIPAGMRGRVIRTGSSFDGAYLRSFKARLQVLYDRRLGALACLLAAWVLLVALAWLLPGTRARRWAARAGALALLWTPVAALVPAALEPTRGVEDALLVLLCFSLGALTDRLTPWPRAPLLPALVALVALTADALAGTQLLARSLLGPNPELGVRFYGIGNELKSGLAVLVFAAVASALYPAIRSRRAAGAMAVSGIVLAVIEGSARIGAGVGGVILVSAGTALATAMLLPGQLTRRRVVVVLVSPIAGLIALAALDLATAHGSGHYTGSVLHAHSAGEVRDIIVRRYTAAYDELKHGAMPFATALALLASALGVRHYRRLLAPVSADPAWLAALGGGLAAGVVGALTEDSGPVLLVVAVFALGCVLSYLWGRPTDILPVGD